MRARVSDYINLNVKRKLNLQFSLPYSEPCIFNCPYCVARNHRHGSRFNIDIPKMLAKLESVQDDYHHIIFTGENDPSQHQPLIEKALKRIQFIEQVEVSTRNINFFIDGVLMSYSLSSSADFIKLKSKGYPKYRAVFMAHKGLDFKKLDLSGVYQATFKQLHKTEDSGANTWIRRNKISTRKLVREVNKLIAKYPECSIRIDLTCQNAKGRYKILRSDGFIYDSWETSVPNSLL